MNGLHRGIDWEGRYVNVRGMSSGDTVELSFPIPERTVSETIGGVDYTLGIRGNNVVSISPPGKYYPFYQGNKLRRQKNAE